MFPLFSKKQETEQRQTTDCEHHQLVNPLHPTRGMDAEELRQLSEGSSKWTRDRSGALAAGYWDILRDPAQELLQEAVPSREPQEVAHPSSSSGRTRFLHRDSLAMGGD